jgi:acyl-homoserine lactone acylase PvdQ
MYGLGFATAHERGFQMTYSLRIIQGRLAETIGERPRGNRSETSVRHDRQMRTFGWARAAARTAANLDPTTRALLAAYCAGVNDSFAAQQKDGTLHPLFQKLGVIPEPWTPGDCLLSWWHLAQFFATDGTRDLLAWHNSTNPRSGQPQPPTPGPSWLDDAAAVVQRGDVSEAWLERVEAFRAAHSLDAGAGGDDGPRFSHAWVVGGPRTTTGAAVLVSDPQTPVRNPSLWMEFHVSGSSFNARGIGVPGSPGLLVGFTPQVAWGLTAMGADQADLFRLETDPVEANQYRWNGQWRKMAVRTERIKVKDAADVELTVRETHLGPVVSEFCFRQSGDPEVALKRIPICETNRDTLQAVFAMMRARNAKEFTLACGDWRFPSANCLYGDAEGHIGFAILGAIPVRARSASAPNGQLALPGAGDADDWQGFVPQELLPQVLDPKAGVLWSANHRPIGTFYRLPLGISTGSMGDTIRSWRLRELLLAKTNRFTPDDVLRVHFDAVNPARREIVRLGLHLRNTGQAGSTQASSNALSVLERWLQAGANSDLTCEGAELATQISTFFRMMATPVALRYGGGESGLARFLKDAAARVQADPQAKLDAEEKEFVHSVLAGAWNAAGSRNEIATRSRKPATRSHAAPMAWFDSLDGFGSLDTTQDLRPPAGITVLDGQTIHCQSAQSYTQFVPLHDPDAARTLCPIGHSDRPDSRYRTSTLALWGEAKLHAAPLSRSAVEKFAKEKAVLSQ